MEKYKSGTAFELNDNEEYIIIDSMEKEDIVYLLASPLYHENKIIKTDYSKTLLVKVDKNTDDMEIETDEKVIEEVINNSINKVK